VKFGQVGPETSLNEVMGQVSSFWIFPAAVKRPVASITLVSPGTETECVILFLHQKQMTILVIVLHTTVTTPVSHSRRLYSQWRIQACLACSVKNVSC